MGYSLGPAFVRAVVAPDCGAPAPAPGPDLLDGAVEGGDDGAGAGAGASIPFLVAYTSFSTLVIKGVPGLELFVKILPSSPPLCLCLCVGLPLTLWSGS